MQAVQPSGDARADWEWLRELVVGLTGKPIADTLPGVFNQCSQQNEALSGITWQDIGDLGVEAKI